MLIPAQQSDAYMAKRADCRILVVDDEEGIRFTLSCLLKKEGYQVDAVACRVDAVASFQGANFDVAFVDIMLGGESGVDVLRDIRSISPDTQVVMFTARPEVATAAEAVRLGAFDYLIKPVQPETLFSICRLALSAKKMSDDRERYRANLEAIFHSVSDLIIMADKDGRLAQFNTTAGNLCGYTGEQIGCRLEDIHPGDDCDCRVTLLETLRTGTSMERHRFECRAARCGARIVNFRSTPVIGVDGTISGAVAVIRDETPLVELERSLKIRGQYYGIIGISDPMQRIYSLIEALADVPTTVLINGESGTGKELAASALHHAGVRAREPFVKVNCSALSESLLESELFGHVRGAFTGAVADKVGRFQKAHRGTLFLDEIGDISPTVQMRLLRVLQESEFERVGESIPTKVDVRIIAATNQNLSELVAQGKFRQDLYYRLNVVRLELPPLRDRNGDISLLAEHFLAVFNSKFGKSIRAFSDDVIRLFHNHRWPGNVRELEHAIEHATILCRNDIISLQHLPQDLIDSVQHRPATVSSREPLKNSLSIAEALYMSSGNKARAARLLGVSRPTIYRHIKQNEE